MYNNSIMPKCGKLLLAMSAALLGLNSCQDDLSEDSHYQTPSFLAGNALEVLNKSFEGHTFKTFLRGIELVGYNDVVDSQILTVLAPTDEAFDAFLKEKGYASIEDLYYSDPAYTTQLITYHLLYYAMDWEKMTNFRPQEGDGATESQKAVQAGMYNRYRTRSVAEEERIFASDPTINDTITVVHYDRYLTVFSEKLFATLGIDAAKNYNYFFPNTEWNPKHLANGFNVMNAAVLDTFSVVTDNGYLYHIDHVIEPVGTIYEELAARSNYQLVKSLFDEDSYYLEDDVESDNRGYTVYSHLFRGLPNIASEWPSSNYLLFTTNSFNSYNLFIPTDEAMRKMFSEYWEAGSGYNSIEDLNPLIKQILLFECVGTMEFGGNRQTLYMCYPELITTGKVQSAFGTTVETDPSDFDANLLCNNGVIFGSSKMDVPGVFSSVAGPAFKDVKYLPYLYVLNGADLLLSLSSKESDFITLIPDTAQFTHNDPAMRLFRSTTSGTVTYSLQQWNDEAADYVSLGTSAMRDMANMHTSTDATELKPTGTQVVESNVSFNYWFVKDGKITTNALFNQQLNPSFNEEIWYPFEEIKRTSTGEGWSNGKAYTYHYPGVYQSASGNSLEKELSQNNDRNYPYYCFVQLLQKAGLASNGRFDGMLTLDKESPRFFAIVPTNDAIKAALSTLPGCSKLNINESTYAISGSVSTADKPKLASYLLSYFVTADRNAFTSYPYLGSTCKGQFETSGSYAINISDTGSSITVNFAAQGSNVPEGNTVPLVGTYDYLPFAFEDGAFQMIDTVLQ
ncbi:MAG: fasciclin domain-containing protein [Bacteroidales bacterium]|nr:fasciclin domain-containing protein [Bacteroidales bacterium]MBP5213467.1 fasciclin domain-containing protein [Bacteroidales bacterium]